MWDHVSALHPVWSRYTCAHAYGPHSVALSASTHLCLCLRAAKHLSVRALAHPCFVNSQLLRSYVLRAAVGAARNRPCVDTDQTQMPYVKSPDGKWAKGGSGSADAAAQRLVIIDQQVDSDGALHSNSQLRVSCSSCPEPLQNPPCVCNYVVQSQ